MAGARLGDRGVCARRRNGDVLKRRPDNSERLRAAVKIDHDTTMMRMIAGVLPIGAGRPQTITAGRSKMGRP